MRYSILDFNQEKLLTIQKDIIKNNKKTHIKLDCADIFILDWMIHFYPTMKKISSNNEEYVWVNYSKVLSDLPILSVSKQAIADKFKKMCELGVLKAYLDKNETGTYIYYMFTKLFFDLIYTNPTSSQLPTPTSSQLLTGSSQLLTKDKQLNKQLNKQTNKTLSKDSVAQTNNFEFGSDKLYKPKKKTNDDEYIDSCLLIDNFTSDDCIREKLKELFINRKNECGKNGQHYFATTCKHYLDELSKVKDKLGAVNLSLQYNNTMKVMEPIVKSSNGFVDNITAPQKKSNLADKARDKNGNLITF